MNPIGYNSNPRRAPRLDVKSPADGHAPDRSITDTAAHNHDMALGILLMTIVTTVPVLIAAIFLLVFKF